MCDKGAESTLSSSGGLDPLLTPAAVADCDGALPALRQRVEAVASSSGAPVLSSRGLGSGSIGVTHSPESHSSGVGGRKSRLWRAGSFHDASVLMTAVSPDTTSHSCEPLLDNGDFATSLRSEGDVITAPHTCEGLPLSPLGPEAQAHLHDNDILGTSNLSRAGLVYAATIGSCSVGEQPPPDDTDTPLLGLQCSPSLPSDWGDAHHIRHTHPKASCNTRSAGGDEGLTNLVTSLSMGSAQSSSGSGSSSSSSDGTQPPCEAPPPPMSTPKPKKISLPRAVDESQDRGGKQSAIQQQDLFIRCEAPHAPGGSDSSLPTACSSERTSVVATHPISVQLLPPSLFPSEKGTGGNASGQTVDMDNSNAIAPSTQKRKKKKNKHKVPTSALKESGITSATMCTGAAKDAASLDTASGTVSNPATVTASLPPPPISMMTGGDIGHLNSAISGPLRTAGSGPGDGNGVESSVPHRDFPEQQQQQQPVRPRGRLATMDDCMQASAMNGDGGGYPAAMGYSNNNRVAGTDGGSGDCTSGGIAAGSQGGSALMMPMSMAGHNYQYQQHNCRNGSELGGVYNLYPNGITDYGRVTSGSMSSAHTPMSHQGLQGNHQPYQQPYHQPYQQPYHQPYQQPYHQPYQQPYQQPYHQPYQQQQPPYHHPMQPPPLSGGGSATAQPCHVNTGHSRQGAVLTSGRVDGVPKYTSPLPPPPPPPPPPQHQQQQQHQPPYYNSYQNFSQSSQSYYYGGVSSATDGGDPKASQGRRSMLTGEGGGGMEGDVRPDYSSGLYAHGQTTRVSKQYNGEDAPGRVQGHVPTEGVVLPPPQLYRNINCSSAMSLSSSAGMLYYPPESTALAPATMAASIANNHSANHSHISNGSRRFVSRGMVTRDDSMALDDVARSARGEEMAADAALQPIFQFTSEVSPRLCRLIEREVLTYLTPSLACLQRRRSQLQTLAGYITAALRHAGQHTGHEYGDISYYIFGSVNMRTVLPDGDNDVTVEVEGLVPRESTLTPPPSPPRSSSLSTSTSLSDGTAAAADVPVKPVMFPVTTDSSTGSVDGTMQLTTTADGCPRLVAPVVLSIASGDVLGRVRDYLRSVKTPLFVDSLVMAEVRVLKLAMEGCNYDITIGQFGGVNCVRFLHEMDAVIGGQHLLKRTLLLLKAWCSYEAHILGGQGGYIGSYAATVMLISMLNTVEFLEDLGADHTSSRSRGGSDGKGSTAAVPTEHLMSRDSVVDVEDELLLHNLASSSKGPEARSDEATPTRAVRADQEGEGAQMTAPSPTISCCGGGRPGFDSTGGQGQSPPRTAGECAATPADASARPLSPLTLFARFLKFFAYFDFDRYCVTAFGPLPLHKISSTPLDLSYLEVDAAHSRPLEGVAAADRAATDLDFLGLTAEGEAAIGHLVRRRQRPLLTVSGVKHLLDEVNRSRRAERQARYDARCRQEHQAQSRSDTGRQHSALHHQSTRCTAPVQLDRAGCAAEDVGLMCPSCNTAVFPVRDMNVLDPLRWSSNMVRGVCRNHLQRIQRAFLEGLRLLDMASQVLSKDISQTDVAGDGASGSAARTTSNAGTGGVTGGGRNAGASSAKFAASPISQLSAVSAASSSSRSWTGSAANGGVGQVRVQQRVVGDASTYGTPGGATENGGGCNEGQRCPGYPAPHSQCTHREVDVLGMLFPRTIDAIRKHSHINCPWSREGTGMAPLTGVPQCLACPKPSLLCAPAIHRMCQPQLIFRAPSTTCAGVRQLRPSQSASEKIELTPSAASPMPSTAQALGGRRGNVASVEQLASRLEEVYKAQDTSEAARYDGPLGEAVLPVTDQCQGRYNAMGGVTGAPPPSLSSPAVPLIQGNAYGQGAVVEGIMQHRPHPMYGSGGGYAPSYPSIPLSPATLEEEYYAAHGGGASGGDASGAGGSSGYGPSVGYQGNRQMLPVSQQQHHFPQQSYARIDPMASLAMQGGYVTNTGDGAANSTQQSYAPNYTTPMPMEGGGYFSYRSYYQDPTARHPQQQPATSPAPPR